MLLRENNDDFAVIREVFLFGAYKVPFKEIRTIIDGGSHIGASAVYFSIIHPGCRIICVEPSEASRKILEANLKFNNVNSEVIGMALSDSVKKINFSYDYKNPAYSKISGTGREIGVATTIGEIVKKSGIAKIDLLKLDIEGEEINVFKSLDRRQIRRGIFETHFNEYNYEDLAKIITSKGFRILPPMGHWKVLNKDLLCPLIIFEKNGINKPDS